MKKFKFSLETVLNYKEQNENNLRAEHAAALQQVIRQEEVIEELRQKARQTREEINEKRSGGFNVLQMQTFERYLNYLKGEIKKELRTLDTLKRKEEERRAALIEARTETKSIGKLKEKRLSEYKKLEAKQEELNIEEFISRKESLAGSTGSTHG